MLLTAFPPPPPTPITVILGLISTISGLVFICHPSTRAPGAPLEIGTVSQRIRAIPASDRESDRECCCKYAYVDVSQSEGGAINPYSPPSCQTPVPISPGLPTNA